MTDEATDTDSLAETLRVAFEAVLEDVRVSLPARVESYDAEAQVVNVVPLVGRFFTQGDGTEVPEALPVCVGVPVEWPGGGGAYLTFPLEVGDTGRLSFADLSLDEWKQSGSGLVYARDNRQHHLADGTFTPGLRSPAAPVRGVRTDAVVLGYEPKEGQPEPVRIHVTPSGIALGEASPTYSVALSEKVNEQLSALRDTVAALVTAFNGHSHPVQVNTGTGTGASTGIVGSATAPNPVLDMGSTTVKVKG